VIHPSSRWLFKCWTEKGVAKTIEHLAADRQVIVTAGTDSHELAMVERILRDVERPVTNLAGQLNLKEMAALIAQAHLFIGVDSLPMHMASACRTPTVALFGPSGDIEWGPWKNRATVITSSHPCRPCGQDGCGNSKISECLTSIESERVINAAEQLLNE
jgi:heptosyltransferase-3